MSNELNPSGPALTKRRGLTTSLLAVVAIALPLAMLWPGCGNGKAGQAAPKPKPWKSLIDEKRAFSDLQAFAAVGGISHQKGAEVRLTTGRKMIIEKLKEAGITSFRNDGWEQVVPPNAGTSGPVVFMQNIVGIIPGERPEAIAIACHYDNKILRDKTFVGANDGASGVATVLELARQLVQKTKEKGKPKFSYYFVFFDGEEAFIDWQQNFNGLPDNCYGSRRMAGKRKDVENGYPIETLVLLDMVGDKDFNPVFEANSHPDLRRHLVAASTEFFGIDIFGAVQQMLDDHIPFKENGMLRVVDIIDFSFGPGNSYWHTHEDTVDKCSPDSLAKVGSLVLQVLPMIEPWLEEQLK